MPLEPATATMNAVSAFFTYLATPAGQRASDMFLAIDADFNKKVKGLFDHIHQAVAPAALKPAA